LEIEVLDTVSLFTYRHSDCQLFKSRSQSAIGDEIATHISGACQACYSPSF